MQTEERSIGILEAGRRGGRGWEGRAESTAAIEKEMARHHKFWKPNLTLENSIDAFHDSYMHDPWRNAFLYA